MALTERVVATPCTLHTHNSLKWGTHSRFNNVEQEALGPWLEYHVTVCAVEGLVTSSGRGALGAALGLDADLAEQLAAERHLAWDGAYLKVSAN